MQTYNPQPAARPSADCFKSLAGGGEQIEQKSQLRTVTTGKKVNCHDSDGENFAEKPRIFSENGGIGVIGPHACIYNQPIIMQQFWPET